MSSSVSSATPTNSTITWDKAVLSCIPVIGDVTSVMLEESLRKTEKVYNLSVEFLNLRTSLGGLSVACLATKHSLTNFKSTLPGLDTINETTSEQLQTEVNQEIKEISNLKLDYAQSKSKLKTLIKDRASLCKTDIFRSALAATGSAALVVTGTVGPLLGIFTVIKTLDTVSHGKKLIVIHKEKQKIKKDELREVNTLIRNSKVVEQTTEDEGWDLLGD